AIGGRRRSELIRCDLRKTYSAEARSRHIPLPHGDSGLPGWSWLSAGGHQTMRLVMTTTATLSAPWLAS
ncbi:hypothetical protein L249_6991, partial [Ophiocordyceps polyrhachis-furcata BCC 54312]